VLEYQQQLLQSNVCYKRFVGREHRRPDKCPANTVFDGKSWCATTATSTAAPSLLDASASRKRKRSGAAPSCREDSDYSTQKGSWCYKACPFGTQPFGTRCRSKCMGDYPLDSPLMCGKTPGTISAALMEMTTRVLRGLFTLASLHDSESASLDSTIGTLVDAGKGFAHPICPMLSSA